MTGIPTKQIEVVRLQSPRYQAVEFNKTTVYLLHERGWLVAFEIKSAGLVGWLRPNAPSTKRRQVKDGQIVIAEDVEIDDGSVPFGTEVVTQLSVVDPDEYLDTYESIGTATSGSITTTIPGTILINGPAAAAASPESPIGEGTEA